MDSNNVTYKDQIYKKFIELNPNSKETIETWNEAISICEKAHNERIRNLVSPLYNLILYLKERNPEKPNPINDYFFLEKNIKIYEDCIDKLLNIKEQ